MTTRDFDEAFPELKRRLDALASSGPSEAPPRVEAALVVEFRRRKQRARVRRMIWYGALAAALILAVAPVAQLWRGAPEPVPVRLAAIPPAPVSPIGVQRGPEQAVRAAAKRRSRQSLPVRPPAPEEVASGFIPVVDVPAPIERGAIVRVRVPRSAMASFGLPETFERPAGTIQADVLLGEDGVARAIRFVRSN